MLFDACVIFCADCPHTTDSGTGSSDPPPPPCLEELPGIKEEMFKIAQFPAAGPPGRGSVWAKLSLKLC